MTYTDNLWLFLILLAGIIIVPGMDMLFVLANALTGGRRAGLAATSGIMAGGICHTLFGTVAVAALSRLVPALATTMILVGSAYMIWIGIRLLRPLMLAECTHTGTPGLQVRNHHAHPPDTATLLQCPMNGVGKLILRLRQRHHFRLR